MSARRKCGARHRSEVGPCAPPYKYPAVMDATLMPVTIMFWPETLPYNANGKILKTELKEIFASGRERG
jgi:hypothetical protein